MSTTPTTTPVVEPPCSQKLSKWDQLMKEHAFTLREYPKVRAAEAAINSVKRPDDAKAREAAIDAIARMEATHEVLRLVAPFLGGFV